MKVDNIVIGKLTPEYKLEVKVVVSKMFRLRLIIALVLFKLAGWVLGCDVKVINEIINEGGDGWKK